MLRALYCLLASAAMLFAASPAAADNAEDQKQLAGTWKPTSANLGDNKIDEMVLAMLADLGGPIVEVDANEAPEVVAEAIATALGPLTETKGG